MPAAAARCACARAGPSSGWRAASGRWWCTSCRRARRRARCWRKSRRSPIRSRRPGKKSLTPEQQREKQLMLSMLDKARDESDRTHPVRLVFEPKSSRMDENEFVNLLLAKTSMETNASINLVMVGLDGRPTGKNLQDILAEWLEFRFATVTRRTQLPAGQGARPHPRARRAHDRPAQRGQGDQAHPQCGRSEGRSDARVQAHRAPGRGHPRDAPAPAGQARAHQAGEGTRGPAQGAEGPGESARQPQGARRRW